jgi:phosphoribosylaminoimidazolecarboxamide formyltransferase/IMP cyclohydrolase
MEEESMKKIQRALISVSDKRGIEEFARALDKMGVEILSTGGTAKLLKNLGIPVRLVSEYTGSPEILEGRVKTLHPKIHGALLALRDNPKHMSQVEEHEIELIDLVVVNLYPFEKTIEKEGVTLEETIEQIDIGGPSMLRSAAKNFKSVAVVCNPDKYEGILKELQSNNGYLSDETKLKLAVEVFQRTSSYDAKINEFLKSQVASSSQQDGSVSCPEVLELKFKKVQDLRYGENPHQKAAFYRDGVEGVQGLASARQLHGKELSFNNLLDLEAALGIVRDFDIPAASIIKHNNPCGAACSERLVDAYRDALACDSLSAFGSIVGLNKRVDLETAEAITAADFVECVVAPGYEKEALTLFRNKKNLRILELPQEHLKESLGEYEFDLKKVAGGLLCQEKDTKGISLDMLKVVTQKQPTAEEMSSLVFGYKIGKWVKSNAIVLCQGTKTVGIGAGQMSRVDSVIIACMKAQEKSRGATLASDAFFPKSDAIKTAAEAGITAIIQPGGSIRDGEVIKAADEAGIAMVFTGMRHFRH